MKWKYKLDVSHVFRNEGLDTAEKGTKIASLIKQKFSSLLDVMNDEYDEELDTITYSLGNVSSLVNPDYGVLTDEEAFDESWDWFYDWADYNRVWVITW